MQCWTPSSARRGFLNVHMQKRQPIRSTLVRLLQEARKEAKVTQAELAERIQATKSYISKIENGAITPSVGVFYRIIAALGMRVEVVKPIF